MEASNTPVAGSRVAVVGGCGAFGRAVVEALLNADARVAVLDLPASVAQHQAPEGVEMSLEVDATDEASVRSAMSRIRDDWSALDGLVNLAGFTNVPPVSVEEVELSEWDRVIDGNLRSTFLSCRAALPLLREGREPSIVNMSSGLGFKSRPGFGPYTSAKAAVIGLTKTLAVENAPVVRANSIAPSAAATEFLSGGAHLQPDERATSETWFDKDAYIASTPMKRLCEVNDVVGPVLFLLGSASRFITGQTIHVNGGRETF